MDIHLGVVADGQPPGAANVGVVLFDRPAGFDHRTRRTQQIEPIANLLHIAADDRPGCAAGDVNLIALYPLPRLIDATVERTGYRLDFHALYREGQALGLNIAARIVGHDEVVRVLKVE